MFRFFTTQLGVDSLDVSQLHPAVIEGLLERSWNSRVALPAARLGHPDRRSDVPGRPDQLVAPSIAFAVPRMPPGVGNIDVPNMAATIQGFGGIRWQHLIYAYMIENTRLLEIFRRVILNCQTGERLGVITPASQRWLWTTEELFFREPGPYSIGTLTSEVRQSAASIRGNAYQRLFAMSLNTPQDASKPAFVVAEHANVDFINAFDDLLHEVWQGRSNFSNQVGARPTDDAKIATLAERICDMMGSRRADGTLSREEFVAVTAMSWFHMTLLVPNHPIIVDLRAEANSPEERLFKIAQRVGFPAHGLSKSYFEIAEPLSRLLVGIEAGLFNDPAAVPALYTPPSPLVADTDAIKTHWSIIRGRDIKATKVVAH
jgi:hypothetical protein